MTDVRDAFTAAGCGNVRTYIQSGNVLFDTPADRADALYAKVRTAMRRLIGAEPAICFRTLREIDRIIAADPFGELTVDRRLKLYVAFCETPMRRRLSLPLFFEKELMELTGVRGREMFLVSRRKPSGMYGFPNACVESFGVTATTRNWSTVTKIAEFARRDRGGRL